MDTQCGQNNMLFMVIPAHMMFNLTHFVQCDTTRMFKTGQIQLCVLLAVDINCNIPARCKDISVSPALAQPHHNSVQHLWLSLSFM